MGRRVALAQAHHNRLVAVDGALEPAGLHDIGRYGIKAFAYHRFDATSYNDQKEEYLSLTVGEAMHVSHPAQVAEGWVRVCKLDPEAKDPVTKEPIVRERGWVPQSHIFCVRD